MLHMRLLKKTKERNAAVEHKWDEVHVAYGIAVFDPTHDSAVSDTIRRADKAMYENKSKMKTDG